MNLLFYFENQINPMRGGTERVADTIAHAMRDRGHNVFYLSRRKVEGEYDITCHFLPDETGNTKANIDYINKLIDEHHIDIVVNEGGNTDDIYMFSKEHIMKAKVVTHLHFSPYMSFKYYYKDIRMPIFCKKGFLNLLKWIKTPYNKRYHFRNMIKRYRYMIEHSDKVINLAPAYRDDLLEIAGIRDADNVLAIFNPTSCPEAEVDLSVKKNIILFVGRLSFSPKRVDFLLSIWKRASVKMPDWSLQILGSGPDEERLKAIVESQKINNIEFLGYQRPENYYRCAKVICMTSLYEGTPMVITEAMQYGCVPIAYNTFSAISSMIDNGNNGFIVKPFNENDYVDKLVSMCDKERFVRMSICAQKSLDKFNYKLVMDQWEYLFNELI